MESGTLRGTSVKARADECERSPAIRHVGAVAQVGGDTARDRPASKRSSPHDFFTKARQAAVLRGISRGIGQSA